MTQLSVNMNKIAVLRNSRGGLEPDLCRAAATCLAAGAHGITVHPRPDQRHIRPDDVRALSALLGRKPYADHVEFNIEGNAFAACRGGYPGLIKLVEEARPTQCTLVPDGDGQLTSDHGFNLSIDASRLKPLIADLKRLGVRVSLFMDADSPEIGRAADIGADRVEIYTGPFAEAFARGDFQRELDACRKCSETALHAGLGVNAGHDLSLGNLGALKAAIPMLAEVSIGHALVGEALYAGFESTVRAYLRILAA